MPKDALDEARETLARIFGYPDFRPGQGEIVGTILEGRDVLAVMPTGSGKSLCYQLPALLRPGLTLVVSPLIALMRDQVGQLKSWGIAAGALNSANSLKDYAEVSDAIRQRRLRLLYVAPERLARDDTIALLRSARVNMVAIDEAHCISQWGHDFRPDYLNLRDAVDAIGAPQTLAVTATADLRTRREIVDKLFRVEPQIYVRSFDRPNLRLAMQPKLRASKQVAKFVASHKGDSGIVYCASRRRTESLAEDLNRLGHRALPYHAGLTTDIRAANQDEFLQGDGIVMCATVAFGMGIDKPDVRFVCHADLPQSIEAYYQEIGRAGRDGLPADTLTLYGEGDLALRRQQIAESENSPERKRVESAKLDALMALCESPRCRRQTLLAAFGEEAKPCGNCDICAGETRVFDGKIEAQKVMSAILRTSGRFLANHVAHILAGKATDAIRAHQHEDLKTFGAGRDRSVPEWRSIFRQIQAARLIERDGGDYGRVTLTEAGRRVLTGDGTIELRLEQLREPGQAGPGLDSSGDPMRVADASLLAALKAKRLELAREARQPAYVIFPDRTLIDMATKRPGNLKELADVHGVGEAKRARYGAVFLEIIANHDATA